MSIETGRMGRQELISVTGKLCIENKSLNDQVTTLQERSTIQLEQVRELSKKRISDLQERAWMNSEKHGFHSPNDNIGEKLALIHSEVSEALEEARIIPKEQLSEMNYDEKGKPIGFPSELADIVIRVFDLAGITGVNLERAIEEKMKYNESRPYMHGKRF